MKDRLNINGRILSLCEPPSSFSASTRAQQWCQQQLDSGGPVPSVWFLKDAVYNVLAPESDSGRVSEIMLVWKSLHNQGVKLSVCQSACQRRLPAGSVDEDLFDFSTLTLWADDLTRQLDAVESGICCIIEDPASKSRFIRESIDPVLSLLAMEVPVSVVFAPTAVDHLLDEPHWRKWRMLPETEERLSMYIQGSGLSAERREVLLKRHGLQIISSQGFKTRLETSNHVYV